MLKKVLFLSLIISFTQLYCACFQNDLFFQDIYEIDHGYDAIKSIIWAHYETKKQRHIVIYGTIPDYVYKQLLQLDIAITSFDEAGMTEINTFEEEEMNPFQKASVILINIDNTDQLSHSIREMKTYYSWNNHAKIIVYKRHTRADTHTLAMIFYKFWWDLAYKIIVVEHENSTTLSVSTFSPYTTENSGTPDTYQCWSTKGPDQLVSEIMPFLQCQKRESCDFEVIGTSTNTEFVISCLSLSKLIMPFSSYRNNTLAKNIYEYIFADLTRNLKGYKFRAYGANIIPHLRINTSLTGWNKVQGRDGTLWRTLTKYMNFTLHNNLTSQFLFRDLVVQIINIGYRKTDFFLSPIYAVEVSYPPVEFTHYYQASGLCFITQRAGINRSGLFLLNIDVYVLFSIATSTILIAITFTATLYMQTGKITLDCVLRSLSYATQVVLYLPINWIPKKSVIRLLLIILFWSIFLINFMLQGAIISLLTIAKRGNEINTFKEILETQYAIEGFIGPDIYIPEDDEVLVKISQKFVFKQDNYECINNIEKSPKRLCLIDCEIANFLKKNRLNIFGQPYLHVPQAKIHNHNLAFVLVLNSPLNENLSKFLMAVIENGLAIKWREDRFDKFIESRDEVKPLGINQIEGAFYSLFLGVIVSVSLFLLELLTMFCQFLLNKICKKTKKISNKSSITD